MNAARPQIISRAEAKALGLKTYFTGAPCARGGVAERRVSSGNCICLACCEPETERSRRYREKNREAVAEYNRRYYEENRETLSERSRRYYRDNRETVAEYARRYYEENRGAKAEYDRRRYQENCDDVAEYRRLYRKESQHIISAGNAKRRAAKRERLPQWFSEFDAFVMLEAADLCRRRQKATGIEWHVDHMIPLQGRKASGLHCGHNLQVIPAYLNQRKHNKLWLHEPDAWLGHLTV